MAVWSIGNELETPVPVAESGYIAGAAALARQLDPTRPIGMAVSDWPEVWCQVAYAPLDVVGVNEYFGWYDAGGGTTDDRDGLSPFLDSVRACYPTKATSSPSLALRPTARAPSRSAGPTPSRPTRSPFTSACSPPSAGSRERCTSPCRISRSLRAGRGQPLSRSALPAQGARGPGRGHQTGLLGRGANLRRHSPDRAAIGAATAVASASLRDVTEAAPTALRRTPLYDRHAASGAKLVPCGLEMPVQYAGIRAEHLAVRRSAGIFDVSHMGEVCVRGPQAVAYLQRALSNDLRRVAVGGAQYSVLCREDGGVLDDLFTYRLAELEFLDRDQTRPTTSAIWRGCRSRRRGSTST